MFKLSPKPVGSKSEASFPPMGRPWLPFFALLLMQKKRPVPSAIVASTLISSRQKKKKLKGCDLLRHPKELEFVGLCGPRGDSKAEGVNPTRNAVSWNFFVS